MAAEDMVGISRLVISRRERAVMLEPRGKGIVLWSLRYGDEVREEEAYFKGIDGKKSDTEMMPLIQQSIKKQTRHLGQQAHLRSSSRQGDRPIAAVPCSRSSSLCRKTRPDHAQPAEQEHRP
jgi:hypothetical protein